MKEFETEQKVSEFLDAYTPVITEMLESGEWIDHIESLPLKDGVLQGMKWNF